MIKSIKIAFFLSLCSIRSILLMRFSAIVFLFGKLLRFALFLLFIIKVFSVTGTFFGYTSNQIVFFFVTYNLVDTMSQMLFREVYRFRPLVVSGELTSLLVKPYHPFARVLFGGFDILDGVVLIILLFFSVYVGLRVETSLNVFIAFLIYAFFILIALFIALSFHILVLSIGIIFTEVDHTIMIYRDLTGLGKLPVDIYQSPLKEIITYFVPIGIMMTFPAKVFFGKLALSLVLYSLILSILFFYASMFFWRYALKKYQGWGG